MAFFSLRKVELESPDEEAKDISEFPSSMEDCLQINEIEEQNSEEEIPEETKSTVSPKKQKGTFPQPIKPFTPGAVEARALPQTPGSSGGSKRTLIESAHLNKNTFPVLNRATPYPLIKRKSQFLPATIKMDEKALKDITPESAECALASGDIAFGASAVTEAKKVSEISNTLAETSSSIENETKDAHIKTKNAVNQLRKNLFEAT